MKHGFLLPLPLVTGPSQRFKFPEIVKPLPSVRGYWNVQKISEEVRSEDRTDG
jgi:hypothetical protein